MVKRDRLILSWKRSRQSIVNKHSSLSPAELPFMLSLELRIERRKSAGYSLPLASPFFHGIIVFEYVLCPISIINCEDGGVPT